MKNRGTILAAVCLCSTVLFTGCSADGILDRMMGTSTKTVSTSTPLEISKDTEGAVTVDDNLEKPAFSANPAESVQYEVGSQADPLTCEATVSDGGTVTYQWYKNNVNSNGGGTILDGATDASYTPDTSKEGTDYYYVVATNTQGNSVSMATSSVAEVTIIPAGEWVEDETGRYYRNNDGSMTINDWKNIAGEWYAFNGNGYMRRGWYHQGDYWYYLNPETGAMVTGWNEIEGNRYFFEENGHMKTGWFDDEDGKRYYLKPDTGEMLTGWNWIDDQAWYYLNEGGVMQTGWVKEDGKEFYLDPETGAMARNTTIDGHEVADDGTKIS